MSIMFHIYLALLLENFLPFYTAYLEVITVPFMVFAAVVFVLGTIFTTPSKHSVVENLIEQ